MAHPTSPFATCGGRTYLVANYRLEPTPAHPHLHDLLADLLSHYPQSDVLLLRPLSREEAAALNKALEDAEVDEWAQIVGAG